MKEATRKRLSELILEELSEKIRHNKSLREKVEAFADYPVEKVSDAILKQFDYLLSSDLTDLIIHLIEHDMMVEERADQEKIAGRNEEVEETRAPEVQRDIVEPMLQKPPAQPVEQPGSIMEHFNVKEPFPSEAIDIELKPEDWFYLYGFSYAPTSTGKGIPTRKLAIKGIDGVNNLLLLDFGDLRMYLNRMTGDGNQMDKAGRLTVVQQVASQYKLEHERILNTLRVDEVLVTLPFWTLLQGKENLLRKIEERYSDMLRAVIDIHDATEWEVNVMAFDQHILQLPAITQGEKGRMPQRESRHPAVNKRDEKLIDKVMFREKSIAQEIHNELLITAAKSKVDYMIRLDTAFMNDWKPILTARYTVGKEKRKSFFLGIRTMQESQKEYDLIIRVTSPANQFTF